MRLKRKLTVWSSALALSCAALSVGVAQAQAQQAQAPASAKQEEPERYGPFFFLRSEPDLLIYVGAVGANDMLNLKKALREHPTISTIVLQNNGGGLVHIGLVVAEEIYERGLNTYIPKDSYCASACSFVFFAGRQRLAVGRLGVHQISAPELTGEQAQFGVSDIVATLPKYGVSADVLGIMFSTPSRTCTSSRRRKSPSTASTAWARPRRPPVARSRAGPARRACPGARAAAADIRARPGAAAADVRAGRRGEIAPRQPAAAGQAPVANPYLTKQPAPAASDEQKAINAAALMIQAGSGTNEEAMKFTREFYADTVDFSRRSGRSPRCWRTSRRISRAGRCGASWWTRARCGPSARTSFAWSRASTTTRCPARNVARTPAARRISRTSWTCAITIASSWKTARSSAAERPALHFGEAPCMSVCARPGS